MTMSQPVQSTTNAMMLKSFFLNIKEEEFQIKIYVKRKLGILARLALVFSRRGLDIKSLEFYSDQCEAMAYVDMSFEGNREQLRSVVHDIKKLIDVSDVQTLKV